MSKNKLLFGMEEEPTFGLQNDSSDVNISECSTCKDFTTQCIKTYRCLQCYQIPLLKLKYNENKISIICPNKHEVELVLSNYINQNKKQLNNIICSNCSIPYESKKKYKYCPDCQLIFCKNCLKIHKKKFNEKHKPISIKKMDTICNIHKLYFNFYCFSCNKNICNECLKFHKINNHDIINFNDIILSKDDIILLRNILINEHKIIDEAIDIFNKSIISLEKKFNDIINHKKQILLFKSNLIDIYEYKESNFQCIENINKLFFYNKHFKFEADRNELDTLFELFHYLNYVDNPQNCCDFQNFKKLKKKYYNDNNNLYNIDTDNYNFNSLNFKNNGLNTYNKLINKPTDTTNILSNEDVFKGRIRENNKKDECNVFFSDNNIVTHSFKKDGIPLDETYKLRKSNNYNETKIIKKNLKINENGLSNENIKLIIDDDNKDIYYPHIFNTEYPNHKKSLNIKKNKSLKTNSRKSNNKCKNKKNLYSQISTKNANVNNGITFFDFNIQNDNVLKTEDDIKNNGNNDNNNINISSNNNKNINNSNKNSNKDNNDNNIIKHIVKLNNIISEINLKSNKININTKNDYKNQMRTSENRFSLPKMKNIQYNLFNSPNSRNIVNRNNSEKNNGFAQSEKKSLNLIYKIEESPRKKENSIEQKHIKTFSIDEKDNNQQKIKNSNKNTSTEINNKKFIPVEAESSNMYEVDYSNENNYKNLINNFYKKDKKIKEKNRLIYNNSNKNVNASCGKQEISIIKNQENKKNNNIQFKESGYTELNYSLPLTMTTCNNNILSKFEIDLSQQPKKYRKKYIGNYNNIFNKPISTDSKIKKFKIINKDQIRNKSKQNNISTITTNTFNSSLDYSKHHKGISIQTYEDNSVKLENNNDNNYNSNDDENHSIQLGEKYIFTKNNYINEKEDIRDNDKKSKKKKLKKKKTKKSLAFNNINNEYNYDFENRLSNENIILNNKNNNENIDVISDNEKKFINYDNNNENKDINNNDDFVNVNVNELYHINIANSVYKKIHQKSKSVEELEKCPLNNINNDNNIEINLNKYNSLKTKKKLANKKAVQKKKSYDNIIFQRNHLSHKRINSTNNFLFTEKTNSMKLINGISCIQEITPEIFCVGDLIGVIKIFDLLKYKKLQNIKEHNGTINSLFLLHDGTILSASADRTMKKIKLINQYKDYFIQFIFTGYENFIFKGIELKKGYKILSCSWDEVLFLWKREDNLLKKSYKDENYVNNLKFNRGEIVLDILEFNIDIFVTLSDKNIKFWNTEDISEIKTINNSKGNCINNSLCKLNDEILIVMFNYEIQIINVKKYEIINTVEIGHGILNNILKLDDGSILITEDINTDSFCEFYIRQYIFEENELIYISNKKEKYKKTNKNDNREIKAIIQFSNGSIVEGICSENNGKVCGDIFFYS